MHPTFFRMRHRIPKRCATNRPFPGSAPPGHQILNVDASFMEIGRTGAVGAIVRDDTGGFVGAACTKSFNVFDAELAEEEALREGLLVAKRLACHNLVIQSDCSSIVEAINSGMGLFSVSAPILEDCRSLLDDFGKATLLYCNRDSNSVAHELARYGRDNPPTLWCDVPLILFYLF